MSTQAGSGSSQSHQAMAGMANLGTPVIHRLQFPSVPASVASDGHGLRELWFMSICAPRFAIPGLWSFISLSTSEPLTGDCWGLNLRPPVYEAGSLAWSYSPSPPNRDTFPKIGGRLFRAEGEAMCGGCTRREILTPFQCACTQGGTLGSRGVAHVLYTSITILLFAFTLNSKLCTSRH